MVGGGVGGLVGIGVTEAGVLVGEVQLDRPLQYSCAYELQMLEDLHEVGLPSLRESPS